MSYSDLFGEIITAVKAVYTDVADASIFTAYEALKRNLIEAKGSGTLFPTVVIDFGPRVTEQSMGIDTLQYRMPLQVWYITSQHTIGSSPGSQMVVADKGHALAAYFRTHHGTYWCEIESATVDSSASEAFNEKVGIEGKTEYIACCVSWEPGLLVDGGV